MNGLKLLLFFPILILCSCIGDDFVDDFVTPEIRIAELPTTIAKDETFQLEATFFNNIGQQENTSLDYSSSDESIATVSSTGLISGISKGDATITIETFYNNDVVTYQLPVTIDEETVVEVSSKSGTIVTTSSYLLEGGFDIHKTETGIRIDVHEDYKASTALPGLYIYLTNNKNTNVGALEIGAVEVYEGAHSYNVENVGLEDFSHILYFCKPFSVKVGDGEIQ